MLRFLFLISLLIPVLNVSAQSDDCSTAAIITSSTICSVPFVGTSAGATQSMPGCSGTADDDVWLKFVATSVSHSLIVTGSSNYSPVFQTFSGSCGSLGSIDCNSNASYGGTGSTHLTNLTIGSTYYIRVYHYYSGSGSGTFTVCLTEGTAPANDECAAAISVSSATSCSSPVIGTTAWASQSMPGCSGNADDDVWYKFTATSVSHSLAVTGSSNFLPVFEVFSGNCASLTSMDCNDNASTGGTGSTHLTNLSIGNTYYFRVYHYYAGSGSNTFTICLTEGVAPVNDDCSAAIAVTSNAVCSPVIGTTSWASQSMPNCSGTADDDVWYKFVASSVTQSLAVTGSSNFSPVFEVFSGNCAALTSIDCNDNAPWGGTGSSHLLNLVIGNTYYFRVHHYYPGSGSGTFTVCLMDAPAPPNDDCSGAIPVSVSSSVCASPISGTSEFGSQSMPGCGGNADDDVWYKFVATANSHSLVVSPSASYDAVMELFSGSCGTLVSINCVDNAGMSGDEIFHAGGLVIGNTYYLRVYAYNAGSASNTFTLCITTPPVLPPANDDCSGAFSLPVTPNCLVSNTVVTSAGATESQNGCAGNADDDIWFSFVAPTNAVAINATGETTTDAVIELFSGNCSSLTSLTCKDIAYSGQTESLVQSGLTIGQTYYFRIYDYHFTGGATFTVNVERVELAASATSTNICLGHNVTLTASGTPTFTWSNGVTNGVAFTPTATATYTASGVGTGSCVNTATVQVNVSSPVTPDICMVTIDTAYVNNDIYWDKNAYPNVDSMIIYREVISNVYQRIGAVDNLAYSRFKDTVRSVGFRNGDPNVRSHRYKLQIRDTCGNLSQLSAYHTSLFLNNTGASFNWNFYDIESASSPVNNYELYRDDLNTGVFNLIGTVTATLGVNTYTFTDPNYATFASTARWGIAGDGFSCNPGFRLMNPATVVKTKGNVKDNFTIPDPPADPDPEGVKELSPVLKVLIMPNPASSGFEVISEEPVVQISIYNNIGALVYKTDIRNQKQVHINSEDLGNGIYNIEVIGKNSRGFKKLVISK